MATSRKAKRKMPVRTTVVKLDGDWEGWEITIRTNPKMGDWGEIMKTTTDLANTDTEVDSTTSIELKALALAQEVVLGLGREWNFVDEEGEPLPLNKEGIKQLPNDLLQITFNAVLGAVSNAPLASEKS